MTDTLPTGDADNPLWLFLHLPKTGGTTFLAHLERHLEWDEELYVTSNWGRHYRRKHGRAEWSERTAEQRRKTRVLAGHRVLWGDHRHVPSREARYITFVRDPAERCASMYNFRRSRGVVTLDFPEWYRTMYLRDHRELMVGFFASRIVAEPQMLRDPEFSLNVAKRLLERCWHVGQTERLDELLGLLCREIGVPAAWKIERKADGQSRLESSTHPAKGERILRHFVLDDETRGRIYADSPNDLALFRWVLERQGAG